MFGNEWYAKGLSYIFILIAIVHIVKLLTILTGWWRRGIYKYDKYTFIITLVTPVTSKYAWAPYDSTR